MNIFVLNIPFWSSRTVQNSLQIVMPAFISGVNQTFILTRACSVLQKFSRLSYRSQFSYSVVFLVCSMSPLSHFPPWLLDNRGMLHDQSGTFNILCKLCNEHVTIGSLWPMFCDVWCLLSATVSCAAWSFFFAVCTPFSKETCASRLPGMSGSLVKWNFWDVLWLRVSECHWNYTRYMRFIQVSACFIINSRN
jgi:hypothetical protein